MVGLVETMLKLHKDLPTVRALDTPQAAAEHGIRSPRSESGAKSRTRGPALEVASRKGMSELLDWLQEGEPWVRYRLMTDIQGMSEQDTEVVAAKRAVSQHPLMRRVFGRLNRNGYWGRPEDIHTWWPKKDTTFWLLPVLADFGFSVQDARIARACEYVLSTQLESGGFGWSPPTKPADCHSAIITESLARLGLLHDPRVQKAYDWLTRRQRLDHGFWCKDTGQLAGPRANERSCAMATVYVLGALAQHPGLRNSAVAEKGVDFLFGCWEKRGKVKYAGHDSQIGAGWERLKYPFTDYKILGFLDVLSRFDCARQRLKDSGALALLLAKRDERGRYTPESVHEFWSDFDFGQKERPSRWVTMLVLRIAGRAGV